MSNKGFFGIAAYGAAPPLNEWPREMPTTPEPFDGEVIERAERRTAQNSEFVLQVAFNYGGRADITDAARAFAERVERGEAKASELNEDVFEGLLSTAAAPPPIPTHDARPKCRAGTSGDRSAPPARPATSVP